jgi:transcriptional regulator with XRE-family HTH domain
MQALTPSVRKSRCTFSFNTDETMARTSPPDDTGFGERLASLRQNAGFTQRKLEKVSGVSHRMIAYYETRGALPPGHVLAALAEALSVSVDELIGNKPARPVSSRTKANRRILRRLQEMEKLPPKDKRELLAIIDTYLEKNRLAKSA